ncbi:putative T7SS-secreted protein [Streptomyces sp. WMMB 322]|uniref:putative T7SS-secreted protein n=1 Tax=Streptomyces sp. WMMB 322 TaxID=1286821 RepID=UPI000823C31E|nr:hypothetical protein [Streptomyces sp. WMMB 322]SCK48161.1 hypothetical protein H180DRAFT_04301 [Streptomyces sp. WMMB 322]
MTIGKPQDWSGLGFDPTPGTQHVVDNLSVKLGKVAKHLTEVHAVLEEITKGKSSTWSGEAAKSFAERVGKLPKYLQDAGDAMTGAKRALHSWHETLTENQPKAWRLEAEAKEARTRVRRAESEHSQASNNPDLDLAGTTYIDETARQSAQRRLDNANEALDKATSRLNGARSTIEELIKRAEALETDHKSVATARAKAVREAADKSAPPSGWDSFVNWLDENKGDILGTLSGVLGVAALFCPVLAPFAVALSLAALATHTAEYASAGKLWPPQKNVGNYLTLGGDLLGSIPGVGVAGRGIISGAKGARFAASGSKVAQGMRAGSTAVSRGVRTMKLEATTAPWLLDKSVGAAASKMGATDDVARSAARYATAGTGSAVTGAQVPSLFTDSPGAGTANSVGGGTGNVIGGVDPGISGSKVSGTVIGVSSALGVGAVLGGAN